MACQYLGMAVRRAGDFYGGEASVDFGRLHHGVATHITGCGHYRHVGHDACPAALVGGSLLHRCGAARRTHCDPAPTIQPASELTRYDKVRHFGIAAIETGPLPRHVKDHQPECGILFGHFNDCVFV